MQGCDGESEFDGPDRDRGDGGREKRRLTVVGVIAWASSLSPSRDLRGVLLPPTRAFARAPPRGCAKRKRRRKEETDKAKQQKGRPFFFLLSSWGLPFLAAWFCWLLYLLHAARLSPIRPYLFSLKSSPSGPLSLLRRQRSAGMGGLGLWRLTFGLCTHLPPPPLHAISPR